MPLVTKPSYHDFGYNGKLVTI